MINFASDNYAPAHPEVMSWLNRVNEGPAPAYGNDETTQQLAQVFKQHFGQACEAFVVWNGTSANVLGLASRLKPYQAVICSEWAHIANDECGAPESHTGSKLITVKAPDGKVTIAELEKKLNRMGDVQAVQPKILSLTQTTEYGTVYSISELKGLIDFAHAHKLLVHIDGARLANAAASLNVSFKAMTTDLGVDFVSFGGTKNGLMGAEAVLFLKGDLNEDFAFFRKQGLHLSSKMRFLSAQFLAYFDRDLWKRNAEHANAMTKLFAEKLKTSGFEIKINQPVQANGIFATLPKAKILKLQKEFHFYVWNEELSEVRLMCSFNTTPAEIDSFIEQLQAAD